MGSCVFTKTTRINVPIETLFDWHTREGAVSRLTPPWVPVQLIHRNRPGVEKNVKLKFKLKIFNIPLVWESLHTAWCRNRFFIDCQTKGPFKKWQHVHRFESRDSHSSYMEDQVLFALPFWPLSRFVYPFAEKELSRVFTYRHSILKYDLENYTGPAEKKRILVSGASGTIGTMLVPFLQTLGHDVLSLVRNKKEVSEKNIFWDTEKGVLDLDTQAPFDAVINLNGEDITRGRWTENQQKTIIDSRIRPTQLLASTLAKMKKKPDVFITSSAIGFYGDGRETCLTETADPGDLFISRVCSQWEKAAKPAEKAGIRLVTLRTGVVLSPSGGALKKMAPAFKAGIGAVIGRGRQYISWISMDDVLYAIHHILETRTIKGPVNLTAPVPVTNHEFSKQLGHVFSKPVFLFLPRIIVTSIWGRMGQETLLTSARVKPEKLLNSGFIFRHKTLPPALQHVLGR